MTFKFVKHSSNLTPNHQLLTRRVQVVIAMYSELFKFKAFASGVTVQMRYLCGCRKTRRTQLNVIGCDNFEAVRSVTGSVVFCGISWATYNYSKAKKPVECWIYCRGVEIWEQEREWETFFNSSIHPFSDPLNLTRACWSRSQLSSRNHAVGGVHPWTGRQPIAGRTEMNNHPRSHSHLGTI